MKNEEVKAYYDKLIEEGNDPVLDLEPLRAYMDKWDGPQFMEMLSLAPHKDILEIGVGTGRLAVKTAPFCRSFMGIDLSAKTVEQARKHLKSFLNVNLICDDFMKHSFHCIFDVIYSSLTFMHFEDKLSVMKKIAGLLKPGGRFVLSIDKNPTDTLTCYDQKISVYPDSSEKIATCIHLAQMSLLRQEETEFAWLFCAVLSKGNSEDYTS